MLSERNLIDETFDLNKSKQYILSILLKKNGLSFIVLDNTLKKIIVWKESNLDASGDFEDYCFSLKKVLKNEELLSVEYQSVRVVFQTSKSLSIPNDLYSVEHTDSFVRLHLGMSADEVVLVNNLNALNAKKVFLVSKVLFEIFDNQFESWVPFHESVPLIEHALENPKEDRVYLSFKEDFFEIQIILNQNLVIDNSFKFKDKEDVLYFLLYTFEQFKLDVSKLNVITYLSSDSGKAIIDFIGQYISKITLADYPKTYNYSYLLTKDISPYIASQILVFCANNQRITKR